MTTTTRELPAVQARESISSRLIELVSQSPIHIALILIGVVWLVPTVGLLVTSFRTRADIFSTGWWEGLVNWHFTFDNYLRVIAAHGTTEALGNNFLNSFIITIPSTFLPVFLGSLAAYAFAWMNFRGRDLIFLGIVALQIVPLQMTFVPVLQIYNGIDSTMRTLPPPFSSFTMTASFVGLWMAHTAYGLPFAIFLLRGFFAGLPRDLIEAAKMDGSSDFRIFLRIILPLSVPALASLTIFQFLWVWNDLLVALIFAQAPQLQPLTTGIKNLLSTYGPEWDLLSAAAFFSMSVPLIVFFSLQRYFVRGLLAGSVKA